MATVSSVGSSAYADLTSGTTSGSSASASPTASTGSDPLANESTFLTLLVSQLKNQDPSSPMDGTTFVTQLAQFSDLEQNLAMRQDLDTISSKYAGNSSSSTASTTSSDTTDDTSQKTGATS